MMEKKSSKKKDDLRAGRVVVNLDREEFEFVDKIGRDALFSTGRRLTNNKIIRIFISVMQEIKLDGYGLHSCEELKNRILVAIGLNKDRREYPRFRKDIKVSCRKLESMVKYESGKTMDVSQSGFRIELKEERKVGEVLEFTINDSSEPDRTIKTLGRIVWVKERKGEEGIEAGIQLTYLPAEDKDRFLGLFYKEAVKASED